MINYYLLLCPWETECFVYMAGFTILTPVGFRENAHSTCACMCTILAVLDPDSDKPAGVRHGPHDQVSEFNR